jgi:hypothetical protein
MKPEKKIFVVKQYSFAGSTYEIIAASETRKGAEDFLRHSCFEYLNSQIPANKEITISLNFNIETIDLYKEKNPDVIGYAQ